MPSPRFTKSQHWELIEVPKMNVLEIEKWLVLLLEKYDPRSEDAPTVIDTAMAIQRLEVELVIRNMGLRNFRTEQLHLLLNQTKDHIAHSAIHYELEMRWVLNS